MRPDQRDLRAVVADADLLAVDARLDHRGAHAEPDVFAHLRISWFFRGIAKVFLTPHLPQPLRSWKICERSRT